jgi:hypothetical protein
MDHGCHQLVVLSIRPAGVAATPGCGAYINRCFDQCKITWWKVPTLLGGAGAQDAGEDAGGGRIGVGLQEQHADRAVPQARGGGGGAPR